MTTHPDDRIELTSGGVTARLSVERYQEAGGFIARCPALILSAQGATQQEADEALDEAIRLMLTDLAERGTLRAELPAESIQVIPCS
jgi:predicted RNase H-like HicB family nuclease